MLAASLAPRSIRSDRTGQRFELAQPVFAWGKRGLARRAARSEADAARFELAALRLDLELATSQRFDDAYLAERALALNGTHRALVADLHATALAHYEAGRASQQAPLAAELEGARLEHQDVELRARRRIALTQLNALLHRAPDAELPPLPNTLAALPAARSGEPPELQVAEALARAREAEAALTRRARVPDLRLIAVYDGFWDDAAMRPMLGIELELPLQRARQMICPAGPAPSRKR